MVLFLVFSAPFCYLWVISLHPLPSRGLRGITTPFFRGALFAILPLFMSIIYEKRNEPYFELNRLYEWSWIRGPGWPLTLLAIFLIVLYLPRAPALSHIRELAGWFFGLMVIYSSWAALNPSLISHAYRVLLGPLIWITTGSGVVWLIDRGFRSSHLLRYLLFLLASVYPSITSFILVLYDRQEMVVAWIITLFLAIGTAFLIYLDAHE